MPLNVFAPKRIQYQKNQREMNNHPQHLLHLNHFATNTQIMFIRLEKLHFLLKSK